MKKSLFPATLFSNIIEILPKFDEETHFSDSDIDLIVQSIVFPNTDLMDLFTICNRLKNKEYLSKILEDAGFFFPFIPSLLDKFDSFSIIDSKVLNFLIQVSACSTISWASCFENSQTIPKFQPLFKALYFCFRYSKDGTILGCIKYLIDLIFSLPKFHELDIDVVMIYDFLVLEPCVETMRHILARTINSGISPSNNFFTQLFACFKHIIAENPQIIDNPLSTDLVILTIPIIKEMNDSFLGFLSIIIEQQSSVPINNVLRCIVDSFFDRLRSVSHPIEVSFGTRNQIKYELIEPSDVFSSDSKFELFFSELPSVPITKGFSSFMSKEVSFLLKSISYCVKNNDKNSKYLMECFIAHLPNTSNDIWYYSVFIIIQQLFLLLCHHKNIQIYSLLFDCSIFHGSNTIFGQLNGFCFLNEIRDVSIRILFDLYPSYIPLMLKSFFHDPYMVSELSIRLISLGTTFLKIMATNSNIFITLIMISMSYLRICDEYENICLAKRSLVSLIGYISLQNFDEHSVLLFHIDGISIFSLMFEQKLVTFVMDVFSSKFVSSSSEDQSIIASNLLSSMKKIVNECPVDHYSFVCNRILKILNLLFTQNQQIKVSFIELPEIVLLCLNKLEPNQYSHELITNSIISLASMSSYFTITKKISDVIYRPIFAEQHPKFLELMYFPFVQLLAGEVFSSITNKFVIKSPFIPNLVLSIYAKSAIIIDIIKFFISLCDYSKTNSSILGSYGFDQMVIDEMNSIISSRREDTLLFQEYLKLLHRVFRYRVMKTSLMKFLSLLCHKEHISFLKFQPMLLDTLNLIIHDSILDHVNYFPLDGKEYSCGVEKFPSDPNGFTFTFWIYLETNSSDYRPHIFSVGYDDAMFGAFLSENSIVVSIKSSILDSSSKICSTVKYQTWEFVTITFKFMKNRIVVNISINCNKSEITVLPSLLYNEKASIICIGGGMVNTIDKPSRIASPCLFNKLSDDQIVHVYGLGINPEFGEFFKPVASIPCITGESVHDSYFMKTFFQRTSIFSLIPLFSIHKNPFDKSIFIIQLESSIGILCRILQYGSDSQNSFLSIHGFEIISYLMIFHSFSFITFKMYMQLAQILSIPNEELHYSLLSNILVNTNLIVRLDQEIQIKIFKLWEKTLFPSFWRTITKVFDFSHLISILRIYYWFEPIEPWAQQRKSQRSHSEIHNCRSVLYRVSILYLTEEFSIRHFQLIIGYIIGCEDVNQSLETLQYLNEIVLSVKASFSFEDQGVLSNILLLLQHCNRKISEFSLAFLIMLKEQQLISSDTFSIWIRLMISVFPETNITPEMLDYVSNKISHCPELFPLSCYFAFKIESQFRSSFIRSLSSIDLRDYSDTWAMWPIILAAKCLFEEKKLIYQFLMSINKDKWHKIYYLFDCIFGFYSNQSYINKSHFLTEVAHLILSKRIIPSKIVLEKFFEVSIHFLFSHPVENHICYPKQNGNQNDYEFSFIDWIGFFPKSIIPKTKFSINVDSQGNWVDYSYACLCVDVFLEYNAVQYYPFIITLCGYLQRYGNRKVFHDLSSMALTESEKQKHILFLKFLVYHTTISKKRQFFSKIPFPNENDFISGFYSTISKWSDYPETIFKLIHEESIVLSNALNIFLKFNFQISGKESSNEPENLAAQINQNCINNRIRWHHVWNCVSSYGSAWYLIRSDLINKEVRESSGCFSFVPFRTKPMNIKPPEVLISIPSKRISKYNVAIIDMYGRHDSVYELFTDSIILYINNQISRYFSLNSIVGLFAKIGSIAFSSVEIISTIGESVLVDFLGEDVDSIIKEIKKLRPKSLKYIYLKEEMDINCILLNDKWSNKIISSFEYIVFLNFVFGRSFFNLDCYPTFPSYDDIINSRILSQKQIPDSFFINGILNNGISIADLSQSFDTIPEIYFFPELFNDPINESFNFVYTARKRLERYEPMGNLLKWAMNTFPIKCKSENFSMPTFQTPPKILKVFTLITSRSNVVFSHILSDDIHCFKVLYVFCHGQMINTQYNIEDGILSEENSTINEIPIIHNPIKIMFYLFNSLVIIRSTMPFLQFLDLSTSSIHESSSVTSQITNGEIDGKWLVIANSDSEAHFYYDSVYKFVIPMYKDKIMGVFIKESFGVAVLILGDHRIALISLSNQTIYSVFEVPSSEVYRTIISPSWGFIVSASIDINMNSSLICHNINGKLIHSIRIDEIVLYWNTFSCTLSFDHLVFSTESHKVYICELNNPKSLKHLIKASSSVVLISYLKSTNTLFIVEQSGQVTLVPL